MFDFLKKKKSEKIKPKIISGGIKPTVLIVLDGFGIAPASDGNAITKAKTPNLDMFYSTYPHTELIASGESVGLPANEEGNSEVGHLILGSGKVILQSLKRIGKSIEDETFYDKPAFLSAINHVTKYNSALHLMGLVSTGKVHSDIEHFYALLEFCRRKDIKKVYFHLFTDGRDAPPKEGVNIIREIDKRTKELKIGKIATISGRYYAMDRDMRWKRTQKAYEAIVSGVGPTSPSPIDAVKSAYEAGKTDEFIEPTVIVEDGKPVATVDNDDAVIFFNFRVDRPRQLTMAFVMEGFEKIKEFEVEAGPDHDKKERTTVRGPTFKRKKWPKNLFFVTMTQYQKMIRVSAIAFPPIKAQVSLPKVLSDRGLRQLHLTESEKERMVTIYFDGLHEKRLAGEDVLIVPSPKVATYDKKPEMSVYKIVAELKKALEKNVYNFIVMNFANPDMVAHSGNIKATIKAIEHVDKALGEAAEQILAYGGALFVTADHGNAEELLTFPSKNYFFTTHEGKVNTDHSNNPVPLLVISNNFQGKPLKLPRGTLADVAPTILTYMGMEVPDEMTGKDLLKLGRDRKKQEVPDQPSAPTPPKKDFPNI
jgi:2,3-bisphosphoglycerate-independent phosphoglycerate mutase